MWGPHGLQGPTSEGGWSYSSGGGAPLSLGRTTAEAFAGYGGRARPTHDHERIGHSTSKVPPFWEPSLELRGYPFRVWLQDLDVWAAGTELQAEQQAPAVVQRLGGAARELARGVPTQQLREGRVDPMTGQVMTGLTMLVNVNGLTRRFGQFDVETSTRCIIDLLGFRRRPVESIDEALARFETLRGQVQAQAAGFELPVPVLSWLLLESLYVPRRTWPIVLAPWAGRLPEQEAQLRDLLDAIRHQGHVAESPHAGSHSWTRQRGYLAEDNFFQSPYGGELSHTMTCLEDAPDSSSAAASFFDEDGWENCGSCGAYTDGGDDGANSTDTESDFCLLYTSPSPRDKRQSRMPSSA